MKTPPFIKTIIILLVLAIQSQVLADQKKFTFDLTGSFHGFGDVTGPFWTILDLKKIYKKKRADVEFTVILDGRAQEVLRDVYHCSTLDELAKTLDIKFISPNRVPEQPKADYLFQLFYGGRKIESFDSHPAVGPTTSVIISDTMHGAKLDEVRRGDRHYYFNPPGIGSERSGLVTSPDIHIYSKNSKDRRKGILKNRVKKTPSISLAQGLFEKNGPYARAKFAFLYGIHNEILNQSNHPELQGQTKTYLETLEKLNQNQAPVIVFTPNTPEQVRETAGPDVNILQLNTIRMRKPLENKVYVVPTGKIPGDIFTGLMSITDFPVLVEGNSTVSTALRLHVPFVMYRSPWNSPQIRDIVELERSKLGSCNYGNAYSLENAMPSDIESLLVELNKWTNSEDTTDGDRDQVGVKTYGESLSRKMSENSKDLADKLYSVVDLTEKTKSIEHTSSMPERESQIREAIRDSFQNHHDGALVYSLLKDAFERSEVSPEFFKKQKEELIINGVKTNDLDSRFNPNNPNFSAKFDELDGIASETEDAQIKSILSGLKNAPKRDLTRDPEVSSYLKEHKVYISMTTSPQRMSKIHYALESLDLNHVEEVLISIPRKFGRDDSEYQIPKDILRHPKVKILRVAEDYGPITKMIPAIGYAKQKSGNRDALVISVDDDIGYPAGTIDELIYQAIKNKKSVVSGSGYTFPGDLYHKIDHFPQVREPSVENRELGARPVDMVEGWGAIAYGTDQVDLNFLKALSNTSKQCMTSDDLVISFALAIDQVPRTGISNQYLSWQALKPLPYGLGQDALHKGAGLGEASAVDINHKKYKECFDLLKKLAYDPESNSFKSKAEILKSIAENIGSGLNPKVRFKVEASGYEFRKPQNEPENTQSKIQRDFAQLKEGIDRNPARADELILAAVAYEGKNLKVYTHSQHMRDDKRFRVDTLRTYMQDRMKSIPRGTYLFALTDVVTPKDLDPEMPPVLAYAADQSLVDSKRVVLIPDIEAQLGYESRLEMVEPPRSGSPEEWNAKKHQFFWRGSTTGAVMGEGENSPNKEKTRRGELVQYSKHNPGVVDAAFTNYVQFNDTAAQSAFARKYPLVPRTSPQDSLAYGNGPSYERVAWILSSNSLLVKQNSRFVQWYSGKLKPWENYVPFESPEELGDLLVKLESSEIQQQIPRILKEAHKTARDIYSKPAVTRSFVEGVSAYSKLNASSR